MFKSLIRRLMTRGRVEGVAQPTTGISPQSLHYLADYTDYLTLVNQSPVQQYRDQFYDVLFGKVSANKPHDELSLYVAQEVEKILADPEIILDSLPVLPASLNKIVAHLGRDEFDPSVVVDLLKNEPMIAAKVIKLANSSFYNRHNKEVTDIKSAFMRLGSYGLSKGVIDGFMSQLVPQSNLYFAHYGKKIWQHSMNTGTIARELINHSHCSEESAQGYLIGLISNLGDIVIYQVMVEAFKFAHPNCMPDSGLFRQIISKNAKRLTYAIAKHWQLPTGILRVLELQMKLKSVNHLEVIYGKYTVSCYIYEARIISKLKLRMEDGQTDFDELKEQANAMVHTQEARNFIAEMMQVTEAI